jgi:uncharacterized SAM-binding protein YcdF (DUF218 family)
MFLANQLLSFGQMTEISIQFDPNQMKLIYRGNSLGNVFGITALLFLIVFVAVAFDIYSYGNQVSSNSADAALVLGAAAWGNRPSPVYRERINESIRLYEEGRVKKIIFTGGTKESDFPSEADVGRSFAIKHGVRTVDILLDNASRTTYENLLRSKEIMNKTGIDSVLLVTDPLHMRRAMSIAESLGIRASPAPTISSRFLSASTRAKFLWRETWLYIEFWITEGAVSPSNAQLEQQTDK